MFENTRKVLDEFENAYNDASNHPLEISKEDEDALLYFSVHLAKALMKDEFIASDSVAKIILAAKELSNEIIVKVQ
jgi:hypothetical protein